MPPLQTRRSRRYHSVIPGLSRNPKMINQGTWILGQAQNDKNMIFPDGPGRQNAAPTGHGARGAVWTRNDEAAAKCRPRGPLFAAP
jgi:hypothetical protein